MKPIILKIKPNSRFHFGKISPDENTALADTDEYIHSDVLFSALVNNIAQVQNDDFVEEFIHQFERGYIIISSGFYCVEHPGGIAFLLPRPVIAPNLISNYEDIKRIKKIKYITEKIFKQHPQDWLNEKDNVKMGNALFSKSELPANIKSKKLYSKEIVPNLVLHEPADDAEGPFSLSAIQMNELNVDCKVHFYFLYQLSSQIEDKMVKAFQLAVEMIKYNGLGGERSSGCGFIDEIDWNQKWMMESNDYTVYMNLSLWIPTNQEEFRYAQYYNYLTRGGRKTKDEILKRVRMIEEGAIIHQEQEIKGQIVNLSGSKKYLRYGKTISIPIPNFYSYE